ncbi:hypothetical protein GCM10023201_21180 [Actinomycetospora corticicola]|uniref:Uncharacterized protein n=1 Tax=Actinomycetospora corticicola TaxID=663602 RepID=A0A7Y9DRI1_9PSEU|nr:hypothetical protein [Actinomycetospora corticicola]NYD34166.1 hypothetical protein [Actinomycetospora corticicola]
MKVSAPADVGSHGICSLLVEHHVAGSAATQGDPRRQVVVLRVVNGVKALDELSKQSSSRLLWSGLTTTPIPRRQSLEVLRKQTTEVDRGDGSGRASVGRPDLHVAVRAHVNIETLLRQPPDQVGGHRVAILHGLIQHWDLAGKPEFMLFVALSVNTQKIRCTAT